MPVETNDHAYGFVLQANEKEARNKHKRAKDPSPWWGIFNATLMIAITAMHVQSRDITTASIFALLTIWHLYVAYLSWKKRRSFS